MDLSNKTLALILVVATSISLVGTILTIDRLSSVNPGYQMTGRLPTDVGEANFTINSSINIVFTTRYVDFGVGNVNGSGSHNCTLNTSQASYVATDCFNFNTNVPPLRIQNQGTKNVTLNISFNNTGAGFIGGASPEFSFKASENETGACNSLNTALTAVTVAGQNHSICPNTKFGWTGSRTLNIDLGMRIPQDAPPGARRIEIVASAFDP